MAGVQSNQVSVDKVIKYKIIKILEKEIRPRLKTHQGDIELVEVTQERCFVKVKLTGACVTCPGAQQTLEEIVEAKLKIYDPKIRGVILVSAVSDNLINQALKILRRNDKSL